ncbi:pyridoxamine 5'-phosphate oxidase family protein [Halococcus sp. PRR34]|uniref:pyridoxamine 5'-phosphate oxidase family protein n=1 Tax=Halococcus sp. PRR34 TaxID=3020830 RepID=UPI00235E363E|nr:pyridoxamine 5'-phosphate oxidase family protein [Halococcus sp. PRR34]
MSEGDSGTMTDDERDGFLGNGGTGVISLAAGEVAPYSTPVSYGYDAAESVFYFRLANESDGAKGDLSGRAVSFVIYGNDDGWKSVVATGQLERTTEESVATESLQGLERVHIPLIDIFGKPPREVTFEFYRLVPDELTTRTETHTEL